MVAWVCNVPPGLTSAAAVTLAGSVRGNDAPVMAGTIAWLMITLPVGVAAPLTVQVAWIVDDVAAGVAAAEGYDDAKRWVDDIATSNATQDATGARLRIFIGPARHRDRSAPAGSARAGPRRPALRRGERSR